MQELDLHLFSAENDVENDMTLDTLWKGLEYCD